MNAKGHLEMELQGVLTELQVDYSYSWEPGYSPEIEDVTCAGAPIMDIVEANRPLIEHLVQQALDDIEMRSSKAEAIAEDRGDWLYEQRKDYEMEQRTTARSLQADPDGRWK